MPKSQRDDYHLLSREQQVVLVSFRTGHNTEQSHTPQTEADILTNLPLWSKRPNHRACSTKMPPSQSYATRCVAYQQFPDDQTLRLQAGAGEDDFIHRPSGPDRVSYERQEGEEEDTKERVQPVFVIAIEACSNYSAVDKMKEKAEYTRIRPCISTCTSKPIDDARAETNGFSPGHENMKRSVPITWDQD